MTDRAGDIPRQAGSRLFGHDAAAYDEARPGYPAWVFDDIDQERALAGASVLEIGPGTGQASRELIRRGAAQLTLVEPDTRLHPVLESGLNGTNVEVLGTRFEDEGLPLRHYDVIVAATSFHWLDQASALALTRSLLAGGVVAALAWNTFQALGATDSFHDATVHILAPLSRGPSETKRLPFPLDDSARAADARCRIQPSLASSRDMDADPRSGRRASPLRELFEPAALVER